MAHKEVCVKVNAWVDEHVAPLVSALSGHPAVVTIDSCEGGPQRSRVWFTYHGSSAEMLKFLSMLSVRLHGMPAGEGDYSLRCEWEAGGDYARLSLEVTREQVVLVAEQIKPLDADP